MLFTNSTSCDPIPWLASTMIAARSRVATLTHVLLAKRAPFAHHAAIAALSMSMKRLFRTVQFTLSQGFPCLIVMTLSGPVCSPRHAPPFGFDFLVPQRTKTHPSITPFVAPPLRYTPQPGVSRMRQFTIRTSSCPTQSIPSKSLFAPISQLTIVAPRL